MAGTLLAGLDGQVEAFLDAKNLRELRGSQSYQFENKLRELLQLLVKADSPRAQEVVEKVRATRRLIAGWVEAGTALGVEGRFLLVGFPPEQKTAMESLSIPKTRDYIDAVLKEVSGQDWKIKFVVKEGLQVVIRAHVRVC